MILAVTGSVAASILYRRRVKNTMKNLDRMLDNVIRGEFIETSFDESMYSRIETKMAHYLSGREVSARNVTHEKEKIKELISDISHQTKTPLANILLYIQLLEEYEISEESRDCLESLHVQAEKLHFLIGFLVKTSRLETGIISLSPKENEIVDMLSQVREQFLPKALEKGIRIEMEAADECACFDKKWTMEAIGNLLDNAVKYTPEDGTIILRAMEYPMFCRIDIQDSGIGIAQEELNKIFTRFYRSAAVCHSEGVGIGLYLCRQIITGQGGYMKVNSELGSGSVFSVYLPVSPKS